MAANNAPILPLGSQPNIQSFDKERDLLPLSNLWNQVLSDWSIPLTTLSRLLIFPNAKHFVIYHTQSLIAFSISYLTAGQAQIAIIAVSPSHQRKGLGTALMSHTRTTWSSNSEFRTFGIGSLNPRFWPGVPTSLPGAISFFKNRGFVPRSQRQGRDMFLDLRSFKVPDQVEQIIAEQGLIFSPWSRETEAAAFKAQARTFNGEGWKKTYASIASLREYHEAMVAFDGSGEQIGWAIMSSPSGSVAREFAFLSLLGRDDGVDGEKIGVVACVGVDKEARGRGVGLALVGRAMLDMRERGMEGVMVEWVYPRGFYEKLGVGERWVYEEFEGLEGG